MAGKKTVANEKTTRVFVDNLTEQMVTLQMWIEKKGEDLPVTTAYLAYALDDIQKAHYHALRGA